MAYIPRTTAPSATDPNFVNVNYGGRNRCIVIDTQNGCVLPNCTGYVHGRWLEMGIDPTNLYLGNATNYYSYTADGYQRGQSPMLGAIACWSGGSDGAGHVAVVEEIIDAVNGTFKISNSAYNSYYFQYQTVTNFVFQSNYTFQGFIYNPKSWEWSGDFEVYWMKSRRRRKPVIIRE